MAPKQTHARQPALTVFYSRVAMRVCVFLWDKVTAFCTAGAIRKGVAVRAPLIELPCPHRGHQLSALKPKIARGNGSNK
jgi:hypothetical protein